MKTTEKMTYEKFCGTWVNTEYEGRAGDPPVKRIFNPDGTATAYSNLHNTFTYWRLTYTVEKRWTDSEGNSWYHVKEAWSTGGTARGYMLFKLDKYNTILELNLSGTKYPDAIDPKDWHSDYRIYYRY
jgi:hypothetical protein